MLDSSPTVKLLLLIIMLVLLTGASKSPETRSEPGQPSPENIHSETDHKPDGPPQGQTEIIDAVRGIEKQKETANVNNSADQKSIFSPKNIVQLGLLIVTTVYAVFAWLQWRAIRRQANIANMTLALTQRPRIKVRSLSVNDDAFECGERGYAIDLAYEVVNYGGTDATIIDSNCTILFRHRNEIPDLPPLPPYDRSGGNQIVEPRTILKGGEARRFSKSQIVANEREEQFSLGDLRVYVIGYLTYRGNVGPHYRTAFCRRLKVEEHTSREDKQFVPAGFEPVSDPDYEYQD